MGDAIDELIETILVDAYGEYEQLCSYCQAFEDDARFPFRGRVIGVDVEVTAVDFDGDERRGLLAVCRRGGEQHTVSLLDLTLSGPVPLVTRRLLDAHRRWSGAAPLPPVAAERTGAWVYPRFVAPTADVARPLALNRMGEWDPSEEYGANQASRCIRCVNG